MFLAHRGYVGPVQTFLPCADFDASAEALGLSPTQDAEIERNAAA